MVKIKRLANAEDIVCGIDTLITQEELKQRRQDYKTLSDKNMRTKYSGDIYRPVILHWNDKDFEIQVNYCSNSFCKNHTLPQFKYNVGKSSRYSLSGKNEERVLKCTQDPTNPNGVPTFGCFTKTFSNWALATEIERLIRINSVIPLEPEYIFHKEGCTNIDSYFDNPKSFYKRGLHSSKAQKVQCKTCKKYTNILPDKSRTTSYNQKRNDILIKFAKHLVNHVPVSRTCDILGIGRSTYYEKLEWLYRCCLEFLETRESKQLVSKSFPRIWLNTDMMAYYLNNVRKKGQKKLPSELREKQIQTQVVITTDLDTRYVFRADPAYDCYINFDQIRSDTELFKDDHLPMELRKNAKFTRYSNYPMEPTLNDTQTGEEYYRELREVVQRKKYVDGLHVNHTYTAIAQMFLIKQIIKTDKWRIVSDDDMVLKSAIKKVFSDEIKQGKLHYFVNNFDKFLSREDAYKEFIESNRYLRDWAEDNGLEKLSLYNIAIEYMKRQLSTHKFYERKVAPDGTPYVVHKSNKIEHPIAMADRGNRYIDVITDTSNLSDEHLARLIVKANDNSVNAFLQEIRRSVSVLERPLVTSRGDGKSYIYSNFNPKYAQMALTILRTYYNFCKPFKKGKANETPAQRLGIANKVYSWEDIIYKR
ncbi:MAG: insertion element protein [Bacillota bacterium]|nr:insertion element protein [Bacillota bacterium]